MSRGLPNLKNYSLRSRNTALELLTATVICNVGREFTKTNEGWAIAAFHRLKVNYTGPLLVSNIENNVQYSYSSGGPYSSAGSVVYNGITYYYSSTSAFMSGYREDISGTGRIRLADNNSDVAALELLKRYFFDGY